MITRWKWIIYLLYEHDEDDNDCSGSTFERDDK